MIYKGILFDLDGTLVDTDRECIHYMARSAFSDLGVNVTEEEIDKWWPDYRREEFIMEKEIDIDAFWDAYKKYDNYDLRKKHLRPYKDTEIITELKKNDYKLGIVTGAPLHVLVIATEMFGRNNFNCTIRSQETSGIEPKPHTEGLFKGMKALKTNNYETIYVGNGDEDTLTSRAAGVFDVLIDRGEHNLIKETPSLKIKSLYELMDFLKL
jgi:phosphoglycolate phosphatase/pyrophosphatase PpaX